MADNPWSPFASYEEWLAQFANGYSEDRPETISKVEPSQLMQDVTIDARNRLKGNRRKTALIIAGLVAGTVVTGGALGGVLAGTAATVALGVGVGALGVSAGALGTKWKMVYNTLNPWASRDPQVIHDRMLVKEDRFNRRLEKLAQDFDNAKTEQEKEDIREQMREVRTNQIKFHDRYERKVVFDDLRTKCQAGQRERNGIMKKIDQARRAGRSFAANTLGIDYFEEKFIKKLKDTKGNYKMIDGMIDHATEFDVKYGLYEGEKGKKFKEKYEKWNGPEGTREKTRKEAVNWFAHPLSSSKKNEEEFAAETVIKTTAGELLDRKNKEESRINTRLEESLKLNNLSLNEIMESIKSEAGQEVSEKFAPEFIAKALEVGDFDLKKVEQNAELISYIIEHDAYDSLPQQAKDKISQAMNSNVQTEEGKTAQMLVDEEMKKKREKLTEQEATAVEERQRRVVKNQNEYSVRIEQETCDAEMNKAQNSNRSLNELEGNKQIEDIYDNYRTTWQEEYEKTYGKKGMGPKAKAVMEKEIKDAEIYANFIIQGGDVNNIKKEWQDNLIKYCNDHPQYAGLVQSLVEGYKKEENLSSRSKTGKEISEKLDSFNKLTTKSPEATANRSQGMNLGAPQKDEGLSK